MSTNPKFVPDLCIGFELTIVRATSMAPYESPVLVLNRIFSGDLRIDYGP